MMRQIKWSNWSTGEYPLLNLKDFSLSAISKDHYHKLMNELPITIKTSSVYNEKDVELLFRCTLTQLIKTFSEYKTSIDISEFVSLNYLIFHKRLEKFDITRGNWYTICQFIKCEVIQTMGKDRAKVRKESKIFLSIDDVEFLDDIELSDND